jgi:hypothetical protein
MKINRFGREGEPFAEARTHGGTWSGIEGKWFWAPGLSHGGHSRCCNNSATSHQFSAHLSRSIGVL